jgi:RNA polymerase sigma-70 factor (ECF subfamily)
MDNNSADSVGLIERARAGDQQALNTLFPRHRARLRRMVEMRLDTRLQARLDASDVVQEAYVEVAQRIEEYLRDPRLPLFLWLRLVVGERLMQLHRYHLCPCLSCSPFAHFSPSVHQIRTSFGYAITPARKKATE